ncbi:MAG: hypothetical protein OEV49_06840 [candidate division Zixibacteria bacterium]|nr:hypothetical protein [candidate division Zixibacteria bacterium]MDH3935735.1 hypothetical protein [candidate division Zixibacteria bacterium]MDH4033228.1 hypothetical protein [candidate division Zixibacteria bacterium]
MNKVLVATLLTAMLASSCGHSSKTVYDQDPPEPEIEYELGVRLSMDLRPGDPANFSGLEATICLAKSDSSELPPVTEIAWMKAITGPHLWLYVFTDQDTTVGSPIKTCRTADGGPLWPENTQVDVQVMIVDSLGDSLWLESKGERIYVAY